MPGQSRDPPSTGLELAQPPVKLPTIQIGNLGQVRLDSREFDRRLSELKAGARRVSALTGQLLKIARYESLDPFPAEDQVSIDELTKEVVSSFLPMADGRQIDLGFSDLQRVEVTTSRADVRILLEILLDNALRYTSPGGKVDVAIVAGDGSVLVIVSDTGPGVPEQQLSRLTERFFRGSHAEIEGNGLGLAIAKAIASRRDIDLYLSNRQDRSGLRAQLSFKV